MTKDHRPSSWNASSSPLDLCALLLGRQGLLTTGGVSTCLLLGASEAGNASFPYSGFGSRVVQLLVFINAVPCCLVKRSPHQKISYVTFLC